MNEWLYMEKDEFVYESVLGGVWTHVDTHINVHWLNAYIA